MPASKLAWVITLGCLAYGLLAESSLHAQALRYGDSGERVRNSDEDESEAAASYGDFEYVETLEPAISDLKESRPVGEGLRLYSYLTKVGGIAFDKVAVPGVAHLTGDISLEYHASEPDGSRFVAKIGSRTYPVHGYDWKLIPILKYANSPFFSCFSLFGTTGDPKRDEQLRVRHRLRYMCSYHPEFKNTLVGLRLMQMDSLLIDLNTFERLPTNSIGREIMGAGELSIERPKETYDSKRRLFGLVERHEDYTAYVITDSRKEIMFSEHDGKVVISGEPYFHFWKTRPGFDAIQDRIQSRLATKHNVTLLPGGRIQAASQERLNAFEREAQSEIDSSLVQPLDSLSSTFSKEAQTIRSINPVVYDAAKDVMRYGAFFRYCKKKNPPGFARTVRLVESVTLVPIVRTPNCVTK